MFYFGYFLSCQQIETNEEESIAQSQLLRGMKLLTYSSSTAYIGGPPKSYYFNFIVKITILIFILEVKHPYYFNIFMV